APRRTAPTPAPPERRGTAYFLQGVRARRPPRRLRHRARACRGRAAKDGGAFRGERDRPGRRRRVSRRRARVAGPGRVGSAGADTGVGGAARPGMGGRAGEGELLSVARGEALRDQGWAVVPTESNFVWLRLGERTDEFAAACERAGVIVRPFSGEGCRVTAREPGAHDLFVKVAAEYAPR